MTEKTIPMYRPEDHSLNHVEQVSESRVAEFLAAEWVEVDSDAQRIIDERRALRRERADANRNAEAPAPSDGAKPVEAASDVPAHAEQAGHDPAQPV